MNSSQLTKQVKYDILDGIMKKMITHGMIYTTYPKVLFSLTKQQVMDIIEALCTQAVNRGWFNIMNSTPDITSVGFDWIFMDKMMFGSSLKIYENKYQCTHPLSKLFKRYYDLYKLNEWYEEMRLIWYQHLIPRSGTLQNFTQENKFVYLLAEMFTFPLIYRMPTQQNFEKFPLLECSAKPGSPINSLFDHYLPDPFFSGAVAWGTGTHELMEYGRKGKNIKNPKSIRPLVARNIYKNNNFLPMEFFEYCDPVDDNFLYNRRKYFRKILKQRFDVVFLLMNKLNDLGLCVSLKKDRFVVLCGENKEEFLEITAKGMKSIYVEL